MALNVAVGDMIRIHAWGTLKHNATAGTAVFKLYFNTGNPANIGAGDVIATTGAAGNVNIQANTTVCWHFLAQITITALNGGEQNGTAVVSALFECLDPTLGGVDRSKMSGPTNFFINTTANNYLELTALVATGGQVEFRQCSIEQMSSP
ncbi:MAG: hypothetical protein EXR98_12185 [Gemmataceae bacterium]|nr:hypothetical protein [Gemmataceae bacterium]